MDHKKRKDLFDQPLAKKTPHGDLYDSPLAPPNRSSVDRERLGFLGCLPNDILFNIAGLLVGAQFIEEVARLPHPFPSFLDSPRVLEYITEPRTEWALHESEFAIRISPSGKQRLFRPEAKVFWLSRLTILCPSQKRKIVRKFQDCDIFNIDYWEALGYLTDDNDGDSRPTTVSDILATGRRHLDPICFLRILIGTECVEAIKIHLGFRIHSWLNRYDMGYLYEMALFTGNRDAVELFTDMVTPEREYDNGMLFVACHEKRLDHILKWEEHLGDALLGADMSRNPFKVIFEKGDMFFAYQVLGLLYEALEKQDVTEARWVLFFDALKFATDAWVKKGMPESELPNSMLGFMWKKCDISQKLAEMDRMIRVGRIRAVLILKSYMTDDENALLERTQIPQVFANLILHSNLAMCRSLLRHYSDTINGIFRHHQR
jgi:hypothetical protein